MGHLAVAELIMGGICLGVAALHLLISFRKEPGNPRRCRARPGGKPG